MQDEISLTSPTEKKNIKTVIIRRKHFIELFFLREMYLEKPAAFGSENTSFIYGRNTTPQWQEIQPCTGENIHNPAFTTCFDKLTAFQKIELSTFSFAPFRLFSLIHDCFGMIFMNTSFTSRPMLLA